MKQKIFTALMIPVLLTGCGGGVERSDELPPISGARAAVLAMKHVLRKVATERPTATIGIYVSSYIAQGSFIPVKTAAMGIDATRLIIEGQENSTSSETFQLLQEIGAVLTLDFVDQMNRSADRQGVLESYIKSLENVREIGQRKINEIEAQLQTLNDEQKELTSERRIHKRTVNKALKDQDYGTAGGAQEKLSEVEGKLAKSKSDEKLTKDILDRYEELLDITLLRLNAIDKNRQILLSGHRVFEVPGIEDLGILEEGSRWRGRRASSGLL